MPTPIGPIVLLQIQRSPLKIGDGTERRYRTDPIVPVEKLKLSRHGAVGIVDGRELMDVHHRYHWAGKNEDGKHGVSLGFTSHYRLMQQKFGRHVVLGCAGENLIVEADRRITADLTVRGFVLLDRQGRPKGQLRDVAVAHPCRPFARFAQGDGPAEAGELKEALEFLDGGTRGFYCTFYADREPVTIELGDWVALEDA